VAMGARTNFAWWWLLAIALAVGNWRALVREARQSYNGLVEEKTSTQEV